MKNGQRTTGSDGRSTNGDTLQRVNAEEQPVEKPMRGDDIAERLLEFAVRVVRLASALPKSSVGQHICVQIVHSGTSAGANYEEARGAESHADFAHKLGVSLKELRETRYWLNIISRTALVSPGRMKDILQEADELCRIVGKSIVTVKQKRTRAPGPAPNSD